ncbi:PTS sugar transporter subunit IIA [Vibrio sp. 03_296]|uniref:PTS sugar transporter subunit IIA n=1 Tax=Vibrio sp. 03_296 TaxID=2024409 RepID=UPI002D7FC2C1|nr:PTS sugar transporter subunit IIA [Vibrio sp. 03_296]
MTNLIEPEVICLDLKANSKEDVLIELVEMLDKAGKLTDKQQFLRDIWLSRRDWQYRFEEGLPFPRQKSRRCLTCCGCGDQPPRELITERNDGQLSDVFFMLASPDGEDHHHIEVLAQISSKLIEEGFVESSKPRKISIRRERCLWVTMVSIPCKSMAWVSLFISRLAQWHNASRVLRSICCLAPLI